MPRNKYMELDYVFILTIFYARTQKFIVSFYGIHTRVVYAPLS